MNFPAGCIDDQALLGWQYISGGPVGGGRQPILIHALRCVM